MEITYKCFYFWNTNGWETTATLIEGNGVEVGYLKILYKACAPIQFYSNFNDEHDHNLVYSEYVRVELYFELYGHPYTAYMEQLIDNIITQKVNHQSVLMGLL